MTWESLAYLALYKKLVLDLTPCGACENDRCAKLLRDSLTGWWSSWGAAVQRPDHPGLPARRGPYLAQELSRREMSPT